MKASLHSKIQAVLFAVMGALIAALLIYLWVTPNIEVQRTRENADFVVVQNVSYREIADPKAPTGMVREFSFILGEEVAHNSVLTFYVNHQNAEVYLGGELVYALYASPELSLVRTPGSNWSVTPIYREDIGKEVRVVLTPVYEGYQDPEIDFFVGSRYAIFVSQLLKAMPEMVLSFINIMIGFLLLGVAIYLSCKQADSRGFYALALLAISLGVWNFTQTRFAPVLLGTRKVFLYYVSLTTLMISCLPLIKSVRTPRKQFFRGVLDHLCSIYAAVAILQLVLQLTGRYDLRENLMVTHAMLVISAVTLVAADIIDKVRRIKARERGQKTSFIWLVGVGVLVDLVIYYFGSGMTSLPFTLLSMFVYVLSEGLHLFGAYVRQQHMLDEKETQLTLSRITTMMSQIRSHFVFNILNAISGMCKYDPEKADDTVVRFARYLRNNINIMEDDRPVLFSTELAHLEDYVVLEQIRFGDKIEFYADVGTDQFAIPPLILQPVVENAIKHGITKKESGGTVVLRTWEEGEDIKIAVEDDGVGFEPSELEKDASVGLKNIRYRLKHLTQGTLDIESQVGVGTTVTITIPKKGAVS